MQLSTPTTSGAMRQLRDELRSMHYASNDLFNHTVRDTPDAGPFDTREYLVLRSARSAAIRSMSASERVAQAWDRLTGLGPVDARVGDAMAGVLALRLPLRDDASFLVGLSDRPGLDAAEQWRFGSIASDAGVAADRTSVALARVSQALGFER